MRAHVRRMAERRWNTRSRWLDVPGEPPPLVIYPFFLHLVSSFLPSKFCLSIFDLYNDLTMLKLSAHVYFKSQEMHGKFLRLPDCIVN